MKKTLLLLAGILFSHFGNAQKIYVYSGMNETHYNYKPSPGFSKPNLKNDDGYYFELGYEHDFSKSWLYMGGISFNQFNNLGGDELNYYSWKTNFLGLQNVIGYSFYEKNDFRALITGGVGVSTLVNGTQQINNSYHDLKKQDDFKGVFIQPTLGLELRYNLQDVAELSLKYNYSKAWNLSNTNNSEKLSFDNNQLALGIHIPLKRSKKTPLDDMQKEIESLKMDQSNTASKLEAVKSEVAKSDAAKSEPSKTEAVDKTLYIKELINSGYVATYFDVDKAQPTNVSTGAIDFVLTYLRSNPNSTVKIYGNADETGSTEYNDKLALERANAVKRILKDAGIQENRMTVVSKGEDTSVDSKSKDAKRLVRRVTFQVD